MPERGDEIGDRGNEKIVMRRTAKAGREDRLGGFPEQLDERPDLAMGDTGATRTFGKVLSKPYVHPAHDR